MERNPDAVLVARARLGDKEAFGQLVEKYKVMAAHIAVRMIGNSEVAHELTQEAMLQAYLSLDRLRDDWRFKSWLYGIVLNVCRSYIREQQTPPLSLEDLAGGLRFDAVPFSGAAPSPSEVAEERELHRLVLEAVNVLPPKSRAATLLFYYEQLSLGEIAAILSISQVAVKSRLFKARRQLRERLLSVYPEAEMDVKGDTATPTKRRRKAMRKVTIADVVERDQEHGGHAVVILLDEQAGRALPIWVGSWEGTAIAMGLRAFPTDRPMAYSFTASLLQAAGATLEAVNIHELRDDTFYAVARLHTPDGVREVDARPSDALALAVRTGSSIYVAEEVLEKAGVDLPQATRTGNGSGLGRGVDNILKEWEDKQRETHSKMKKPLSEEEKAKSYQELWDFVLGSQEE